MSRETYRTAMEILRVGINDDLGTPAERKNTAKMALATAAVTGPVLGKIARETDAKTALTILAASALTTVIMPPIAAINMARRETRERRNQRSEG